MNLAPVTLNSAGALVPGTTDILGRGALLAPPPEIHELIKKGALFVANHSGGKDSQAMLIELLKIIPSHQLVVIHASLGEVEWEGALEHAQQQAENAGLPFIVGKAVKTFFEMVEHRFAVRPGPNSPCWPSAANRQCTSDLKRGPIEREVRRLCAISHSLADLAKP